MKAIATRCGVLLLGALTVSAGEGSDQLKTEGTQEAQSPAASPAGLAPAVQQVRADFDGLFASDIQLTQQTVGYVYRKSRVEVAAAISYNRYDLDYQPAPEIDFLGRSNHVSERRIGGQIATKFSIVQPLQLLSSVGVYDGYTDYRSAWLNEYYRQQFSDVHGFGDEYVTPNPHGENANIGLRYEYLPTTGFVQGDFTYLHDEIAPGYEIDFDGLRRGRQNLYTGLYHLAFENVLSRRVRVLNEFRLTDTTNRKLRYNYNGSINIAPAEDWVVRLYGGYTQESPQFEAHYLGGTVEVQPVTGWWFSAHARYYRDSGEIENSLFSSAAPGLTSWQVGVGVRHQWGGHSIRISAAPYFTRYDAIGINTAFFQNLYKDRTWVSVQLAYNFEF